MANYQYCVWFKGERKIQHKVSEGAKIKQNVNLFLYLNKKNSNIQHPPPPNKILCWTNIPVAGGGACKENILCKNDHQNHKKGEIHCSEVILEQFS